MSTNDLKILKNICNSYNGMNRKTRKKFKELGFTVEQSKKNCHYRLKHQDVNKFYILPSSPSDYRGTRNLYAIMKRDFENVA